MSQAGGVYPQITQIAQIKNREEAEAVNGRMKRDAGTNDASGLV
jgi:hypothetical protein